MDLHFGESLGALLSYSAQLQWSCGNGYCKPASSLKDVHYTDDVVKLPHYTSVWQKTAMSAR